jgi:hypothetical protein
MGILEEKMNGSASRLNGVRLTDELPFRAAFSAVLAVGGVCLYAFVPVFQSSPYLYVVSLLVAFGVSIWGAKKLRLLASNSRLGHARILEISGLACLMLLVLIFHQPLVAAIQSIFNQ